MKRLLIAALALAPTMNAFANPAETETVKLVYPATERVAAPVASRANPPAKEPADSFGEFESPIGQIRAVVDGIADVRRGQEDAAVEMNRLADSLSRMNPQMLASDIVDGFDRLRGGILEKLATKADVGECRAAIEERFDAEAAAIAQIENEFGALTAQLNELGLKVDALAANLEATSTALADAAAAEPAPAQPPKGWGLVYCLTIVIFALLALSLLARMIRGVVGLASGYMRNFQANQSNQNGGAA